MEKIFKKSSFLIASQMLCRVLALFYTYFIAKSIGVENFGLYTVAMSYFSLVLTISDLGISRYLIREVASSEKDMDSLFTNVLAARMGMLLLTVLVFSAGLYLLDPVRIRVYLSILGLVGILPTAVYTTFENFLVAQSNFKLSTWGLIIFNLLNIFFGVLLVLLGYSVVGVVLGGVIAGTLYVLISYLFFKEQKIKIIAVNVTHLKGIVKGSIPYGFLGILGLLYFKIDSVILSYLRNSYETGIYGAGYKFLENVIFIPAAVSLVSFPVAAKMHKEGSKQIKVLFKQLFLKMGGAGVLVMILFLLFAPFLPKFLPQYAGSVAVIQIISLSIPFIFLHVPLSQLVLSSDKFLGAVIKMSLIPVTFNIILNLIFIPHYGYIGAAWITVLSDILSLLSLLFVIKKHLLRNYESY